MGIATLGTTKSIGGISRIGKTKVVKKTTDLTSLEGLRTATEQAGYGKEVSKILDQKSKLSFLQRLGKGLGAFNPAEAVLTGIEEESPIAGIAKYGTGIAKGIGSAITGRDYEGERRYFSDVAEKLGVENGIAKFGIGFVGDVLLDPTTYFGGAIAKGIGFTAKGAGKIALRGVEKLTPETAIGLKIAGEGLQDALGKAFQYGYKSSRGATDDILKFLSKEQQAKLGLASSNLDRLGTGVLTKSQREELALKMIAGKRAEFLAREAGDTIVPKIDDTLKPLAQEAIKKGDDITFNYTNLRGETKIIKGKVEKPPIGKDFDFFTTVDDKGIRYVPKRTDIINQAIKGVSKTSAQIARETGETITPQIDSVLQPLAQEARKYKSAEEFVKVIESNKLEHGSKEVFSQFKQPGEDWAIFASKPGEGLTAKKIGEHAGQKYEVLPVGKIKTLDPAYIKNEDVVNIFKKVAKDNGLNYNPLGYGEKDIGFGHIPGFIQKDIIKEAKKLGYNHILFREANGEISHAFTNAENLTIIPSKSQLTDFYNQATKTAIKIPAEIARETALKGTSKEVAEVIEKQTARGMKFGEQLGLENPYEVYFPFIKKDKLAKFLNESKGIKVGSEGYRKQFKNLLTNENMELDPAKAFFTRESQIVSDNMTRDFLGGFVKKYGKGLDEFKSVDDAVKQGYTLIKEKGIFGKELGYVNKYDGALIRDSISPEFQTVNMLAKATGFDAITSLFKRSVTGLFAPFHVRNYVSGLIQNFEVLGADAFNPKNIAIGQKIAYLMGKNAKIPAGTLQIGGKTMKFSEVMKPFVNRFSGDTFYNNDFMFAIEKGVELKQVAKTFGKQRIVETAKTLGFGQEAIPFKIGRTIGQFIEHQQKATAYITALGQGKNIDDALRLAEKAGFDYRALTRFESQIMRRIIPFYSFTRKNIELQLRTLGENPQRINQVLRFFGSIGESISEEERQALPAFIRESIGIKLQDTPEGLKQYISSFGTPIEAFTQLFGSNPILRAISTMNPILKVPVEIGIGKDSFRQRDLKDVYNANEYKLAPQIIKDLLGIKEVQKDILEKNKTGKLVKVGERTQYVADPVRLLIARSLFTSRGVSYLDQVFSNDLRGLVKVLKTTTGIKPQQIDIEMQKAFKEKEEKRKLEDLLIRTGEVRRFERIYTPK